MELEPVDAVVTWVDGYDREHQRKLEHYLLGLGVERPPAVAPTRFNQQGEIEYCLRSLLSFAPWIRKIYIVTDRQTPSIVLRLKETIYANKIELVDHHKIFVGFEECLPTFNSLSIESMLWRIPTLANHFIYLNDDCFIVRPVRPEDFFCEDSVVISGQWKFHSDNSWYYRCKRFLSRLLSNPNEHRIFQENSAKLAGFSKNFFHLPHVPFPLKKSTLESFFSNHPKTLLENIHYSMRDLRQFWPISLAIHLEIQKEKAKIVQSKRAITVNGAYHSLRKIQKKFSQVEANNTAFLCVQSMDAAPPTTQRWLEEWMAKKIPG